MRTSLALAATLFGTAAALAQSRPNAPDLTCRQVAAIVAREGAVVVGTGGPTYDRFVSDARFCERNETTRPSYTATRDDPQCLIGSRCVGIQRNQN